MTDGPDAFQTVYDMFLGLLKQGRGPEEAAAQMRRVMPEPALVDSALNKYRDVVGKIINARDPQGVKDPTRINPWYTGPRATDEFWPALRTEMKSNLDDEAINSVDLASTKVLSLIPPPWKRDFSGRGLVLGYVQSGKTSNYTAVISKAADAGYKVFIVLSGIHNNLRKQTQLRLEEQLVDINKGRWFPLTKATGDFGDPGNPTALLTQDSFLLLAVVKKNKKRLQNLNDWLARASELARASCPILVIDDEADQASINTRAADEDRAVINQLVLELLAQPKVAYVGYTATPFANIFVDPNVPQDLYPRDFIVDLPRPRNYFGPERIFGREPLNETEAEGSAGPEIDGLDMVLTVPDNEAKALRPPRKKEDQSTWEPQLTSSLREAVRWFILATAARRARGQTSKHSSMLIHTTQLARLHHSYTKPVLAELATLRAGAADDELATLWNRETARVPAESVDETPLDFSSVRHYIESVLGDVRVVVDNYMSTERLGYEGDPQVVIVIGGNTLSRGLTLEGLVVSFFLRSANAYDTLLQMGRWFGYRRGYADLPRIWLTNELAEYFQFLATVEAEIRLDVARYEREDLTPTEFAIRVRTHPQLAITSALKMKATQRVEISYSGRRLQTILFDHKDAAWLSRNWKAGQRLVDACGGISPDRRKLDRPGQYVWKGVPVERIDGFLRTYRFHPDAVDLVSDKVREYIQRQNAYGELITWNVALVSLPPEDAARSANLSEQGGSTVGLINRSAMKTVAKPHANIKTLMSREDRVIDLGLSPEKVAKMSSDELQDTRPAKVGLLVLYPIDKDSTPRHKSTTRGEGKRTDLKAVGDMLGVGLVFPDAERPDTTVSYRAVALPLGDVDEIDEPDIDEIDTEDTYNGEPG